MAVLFMKSGQVVAVDVRRDVALERIDEADHVEVKKGRKVKLGPRWVEFPSMAGRWPDGSHQVVVVDADQVEGIGD